MKYTEQFISPTDVVIRETRCVSDARIKAVLSETTLRKYKVSEDIDGVITVLYENGYKYNFTPVRSDA